MKRLESDPCWYAPSSLAELAALCAANPDSSYRLVGGDTGRGKTKDLAELWSVHFWVVCRFLVSKGIFYVHGRIMLIQLCVLRYSISLIM